MWQTSFLSLPFQHRQGKTSAAKKAALCDVTPTLAYRNPFKAVKFRPVWWWFFSANGPCQTVRGAYRSHLSHGRLLSSRSSGLPKVLFQTCHESLCLFDPLSKWRGCIPQGPECEADNRKRNQKSAWPFCVRSAVQLRTHFAIGLFRASMSDFPTPVVKVLVPAALKELVIWPHFEPRMHKIEHRSVERIFWVHHCLLCCLYWVSERPDLVQECKMASCHDFIVWLVMVTRIVFSSTIATT